MKLTAEHAEDAEDAEEEQFGFRTDLFLPLTRQVRATRRRLGLRGFF